MTPWVQRSREERALLNSAFCTNLLWHAARGHSAVESDALPFEEAFLVLPFVLDRKTREALPRDTRTSLAVWLESNPLARGRIADRAQLLVGFTKEALSFGGFYGLIAISEGRIRASAAWQQAVRRSLSKASNEVRECAKKAEFVGRWFAQTGTAPTVFALIGVRP